SALLASTAGPVPPWADGLRILPPSSQFRFAFPAQNPLGASNLTACEWQRKQKMSNRLTTSQRWDLFERVKDPIRHRRRLNWRVPLAQSGNLKGKGGALRC